MSELLDGLEGAVVYTDDVIVHGRDMTVHNTHPDNTLARMEQSCLKINKEKSVFRKSELQFLGHKVDSSGMRADPGK